MALDTLLARLEGRAVTPVTDGAIADVTPKPPTRVASTPQTCPTVTCVTAVTAENEDTAGNATNEPRADPAMEARRQRVLAMLDDNPALRLAVVCDGQGDPVPVAVGIRGKATCELLVPRDRYDGVLLLDLIEGHGITIH